MSKVSPTVRKQKWPLYLRADNRQLKIPPMTQDGMHYFRFFVVWTGCLSAGISLSNTAHRKSSSSVSWKSAANKFSLPECWWKTICTLDYGDKTSILCLDDFALHLQPNPQPLLHCMICAFKLLAKIAATHLCEREETGAKTSYYL